MTRQSSKDWRKSRKYYFNNQLHYMFLTKRRGNVLNGTILHRLEEVFENLCNKMKCQLIKFEGHKDHIKLLVKINPTISISVLAGKLKGTSSHLICKEFPEELKESVIGNQFWASSYAVVSHGSTSSEELDLFLKKDSKLE